MASPTAELPNDLIEKLRKRAAKAETRNDLPPTARSKTVTVGSFSITGVVLDGIPGEHDPGRGSGETLPEQATAQLVAEAEQRCGLRMPEALVSLYTSVANGGFGPGAGLLGLEKIADFYRGLIDQSPGPGGQAWPQNLLPLTWTNPGHECIDIATGAIVYWDEEELSEGDDDEVWERSFKPEAATLSDWLSRWVDTPTPEDATQTQLEETVMNGMRQTLAYWRSMTPEQRTEYGLPETGWEEQMFGHLGIDLSKL